MIPNGLIRCRRPLFQALLATADAAAVCAALGVALAARHRLPASWWMAPPSPDPPSAFRLLLLALTFVVVYASMGLYTIRRGWAGAHLLVSVGAASCVATALFLACCYAVHDHSVSRFVLVSLWTQAVAAGAALRLAAREALRWCARRGLGVKRIAVVGDDPVAARLCESIEASPHAGLALVAQAIPREAVPGCEASLARATLDDLTAELLRLRPHRVLFTADISAHEELQGLAERCLAHDVEVLQVPRLQHSYPGQVRMGELLGVPVLGLGRQGLEGWELLAKETFDRAVALGLLLLLAPLLAALALAVRLDTGGPVLHRRRRAGRGGVPFTLLRFEAFRGGGGPRAPTLLGTFLMESGLDRLPQLLNVLAGQMSLVGPRPDTPEGLRRLNGWQRRRLSVKPGLTGLSRLEEVDAGGSAAALARDLRYVETQSPLLDARILLFGAARVPGRLLQALRLAWSARTARAAAGPSGGAAELGGSLGQPTRGAP